METEGQFRVIDPETGKPRPKGMEEWPEAEFQDWKREPFWKRYKISFSIWPALLIVGLALSALLRSVG